MSSKIPMVGEYFVYKLNPAETLALIHDDPEVAEACTNLQAKCKKYIGCCVALCTIPILGSLAPIKMSMVSRGLLAQPNGVIPADMSLPILPTTYHPRHRKPLIVDPPLPWDDCYHLTLAEMTVRVMYSEWDSRPRGKYALLPRGQTAILRGYRTDDEEWRAKLQYMKETGGTDFEPDPLEDQEEIELYYEKVKSKPDRVPINAGVQSPFGDDPRNRTDGVQDTESETYSDEAELAEPEASLHSSIADLGSGLANFDYAAALDITLDLEKISDEELADNIYDFYAELKELGYIILNYVKKKKAQLADVQRQDAEFDAKVSLARQSRLVDENMQCTHSVPNDANDTADDLLPPRREQEDTTPISSDSGIALPVDAPDHIDAKLTLPVHNSATGVLPIATLSTATASISSMVKGNASTSALTSSTPEDCINPPEARSGRLERTVRCFRKKCGRLVEASRKAGLQIKARFLFKSSVSARDL